MRLWATFIFALILALPLAGHGQAADTQPTEYQLKAAYLYHFAQFVDWPPAAFAQANGAGRHARQEIREGILRLLGGSSPSQQPRAVMPAARDSGAGL